MEDQSRLDREMLKNVKLPESWIHSLIGVVGSGAMCPATVTVVIPIPNIPSNAIIIETQHIKQYQTYGQRKSRNFVRILSITLVKQKLLG